MCVRAYLASSFLSEDLFSSDPAVLVNQVDPVPKNFKASRRSFRQLKQNNECKRS
jgi:hypothetical protein